MGDNKHAFLAFEKQIAEDGFHDVLGPNGSHTITGVLGGTDFLNMTHLTNGVQNPYLGKDTMNFTIEGGHDFHLTLEGFNPLLWNGTPPTQSQLLTSFHDLLELTFDPSTGVTSQQGANAAEHISQVGHDIVLTIHTGDVDGTITFQGLADLIPPGQTENFSWLNIIPPEHVG
jgi:hypothetical protein